MHLFWELFGDAPLLVRLLSLLQLAFMIWMLVDAYQRRAEVFWYFIIFFLQPIGVWIYFFVVKLRTMRFRGIQPVVAREPKLSLDELRYRVDRTPTVANRLALAQRLIETGRHADAVSHVEAILVVEPEYCAALHALAECRLATGHAEQAVAPLTKLLDRDARWSNYRAWRTLIDVHLARSQPAEALKASRELERRMPTLENKCLLAEHLLNNGAVAEAVPLLDQMLEDHRYSPWGKRWRNWHWAREARRLLARAEKDGEVEQGADA